MNRPDFSRRADLTEQMDLPDCDSEKLERTLQQFVIVNRLFVRYRSLLLRHVIADMQQDPTRIFRLVDLGAGGCDITRWLIQQCRRHGLRLKVTALEYDPRIARYARNACRDYPEIEIREYDVRNPLPLQGADYIFANHLLHHLSHQECIEVIRQIDQATPRAVLLSDLRRSAWSYYGFLLAAPLFFRNSFVVPDGLASIRRGFTPDDLHALLRAAAPTLPFSVQCLMPGRIIITLGPGPA